MFNQRVTSIFILLAIARCVMAEPLMLHEPARLITADDPLVLTFTRDGDGPAYLSLEGRLVGLTPDSWNTWRGGSMPCVQYLVNGELLRKQHIVSFADIDNIMLAGGSSLSWIGPYDNWRLNYSPDFEPFEHEHTPVEMTDNPYLHVFDITSFVVPGENKIEIRHYFPHYPESRMAVRRVQVLDQYERPARELVDLFATPSLGDDPIVPQRRFKVAYDATIDDDGVIHVRVGDRTWQVASTFLSFNDGHTLDRTIVEHDERIEVRDELTNHTDKPLGIRIRHEVLAAPDELWRTYMSGLLVPLKRGRTSLDVHPAENPTVYICTQSSGIGLMPRDDVFRSHINLVMEDGGYGIHDNHFALAPGASWTMRWDIYPTANGDYYDFINAARRALNANYLIDGNLTIAHGHEGAIDHFSDDDIRNLVDANNSRYILLSTIPQLDEDGSRLKTFAHGSALLADEFGRWNRHYLEQVIGRYRQVRPNVTIVPYIDTFVCSEPNAREKYADSVAQYADGRPQSYTGNDLAVMYPTLDNSYGKAMDKVFDYLLQVADGFYLDESSMYYLPDAGTFDYRGDIWDGHSCLMDPKTHELTRTVTSSVLYTLDFRLAQLRKAKMIGKAVWMNFAPMTDAEAALQSYRFIESYSNTAAVYSHLTSPLSLGNEDREKSERDLGRSIRDKLMCGGLFLTYGQKYQTLGNMLQDIYPIHPIELHRGYIIAVDKIVTCASGVYGFGDDRAPTVRVYDPAGFRITDRGGEPAGRGLVRVKLGEGELAIIFRER